jgi:hypothetical protein
MQWQLRSKGTVRISVTADAVDRVADLVRSLTTHPEEGVALLAFAQIVFHERYGEEGSSLSNFAENVRRMIMAHKEIPHPMH